MRRRGRGTRRRRANMRWLAFEPFTLFPRSAPVSTPATFNGESVFNAVVLRSPIEQFTDLAGENSARDSYIYHITTPPRAPESPPGALLVTSRTSRQSCSES